MLKPLKAVGPNLSLPCPEDTEPQVETGAQKALCFFKSIFLFLTIIS